MCSPDRRCRPGRFAPVGWRSPAEIVVEGFDRHGVVMLNEGHAGLSRCVRTRRVGRAVLPAAHAGGCRHLAMEALPNPGRGPSFTTVRPGPFGYLGQPEMIEFIDAALVLGWTLVGYEAVIDMARVRAGRPETINDVNDRERQQATNLAAAHRELGPHGKLLVWCGNGHHYKRRVDDWVPMGLQFTEVSGVEPFCIDQLASVSFGDGHQPRIPLTAALTSELERHGGTAGFTGDDAPPGYRVDDGYDAVVLSIDNTMIDDATSSPCPAIEQ
jgi:hypothetical protein